MHRVKKTVRSQPRRDTEPDPESHAVVKIILARCAQCCDIKNIGTATALRHIFEMPIMAITLFLTSNYGRFC